MASNSNVNKTESREVQRRLNIGRSKSFVYSLIAVVALAFGIVAIKYLASATGYRSKVIERKEKSLTTLEANVDSATKLTENLSVLDSSLINGTTPSVLILDALPSIYDAPALSTSVNNLASKAGVTLSAIKNVDQGDVAEKTSLSPEPIVMPIEVSGQGKYDQIMEFVSNLEKSIRPFVVYDISLRSATKDSLNFRINMQTYYQPKQEIRYREERVQ